MYVLWKLVSVLFEILLVLAQDRYTVCAECTSAWTSFWAHTMVLLGVVSHVEVVLVSAQDSCMLCAECTLGSEIILGTPDGTPSECWSRGSSFRSIWR